MSEDTLKLKEDLKRVGIVGNKDERSGSFLMVDDKPMVSFYSGVEVSSLKSALEKYDWLEEYRWNLVEGSGDYDGYFIRVSKDTRVGLPVEACLYLKKLKSQRVHNVIIVEENSELNVITGCTSERLSGLHLGVSEFYVKKNAKLTFTMIHNWKKKNEVLPKTGILVEDDGEFISNYILLSPVKIVKSCPVAHLGKNAKAIFNSVVVAFEGCEIDLGSTVY